MMLLLGIVLGWVCKLVGSQQHNPVPRITAAAAEQNPAVDEETIVETRVACPTHFLTKIESFSLCSKHDIRKHQTREFEAGYYKWRLIIYPDGDQPSYLFRSHDYVSVYLAITETSSLPIGWEIDAIFTIFLYNQILDNYRCFRLQRRFNETKCVWGFPKLISNKTLNDESSGYLVDDNFVLGAEVFVLTRPRVIERVTLLHKSLKEKFSFEITEFSKLGQCFLCSKEFIVGDVKWKIKVYPGGAPTYEGFLSVYLICVSADSYLAHQSVKAKFAMKLQGDVFCSTIEVSSWFTSSENTHGFPRLTKLDKVHNLQNGFLVDDKCTLVVDLTVQAVVL